MASRYRCYYAETHAGQRTRAIDRRRPALIGVDLLHQATVRRPDFRLTGAGRKADLFFAMSDGKPVPTFPDIAPDLVGLLMSHGARIRRAARPRCDIRLAVFTPTGEPAGEIYIG